MTCARDTARIPVGMNQRDLMFLKDASMYSSQKEYRIVLIPPESYKVDGFNHRVSVRLGCLEDITEERRSDHALEVIKQDIATSPVVCYYVT